MNYRNPYRLIFCVTLLTIAREISIESKSHSSGIKVVTKEFCKTSGCYEAATLITQNMDEKIDPCINFYKFACGNFIKRNEIPENKTSISRMDAAIKEIKSDIVMMLQEEPQKGEPRIFELVRNYFKACMDTVTIDNLGAKPILNIIKELGGWPLVEGDSWNEDSFSLLDTMIKLKNLGYQHKYLINIYVYNNYYNTSIYQLFIDKAEQYWSERDLNQGLKSVALLAYRLWMVDVAVELGADREKIKNDSIKVVEFEKILSQLPYIDSQANYEIHNVSDLETNLPWFPWLTYLNDLTNPFVKLNSSSSVYTDEPYYLELLVEHLKDVDNRVIANYLIWRVITDSLPHLSKKLQEIKASYYDDPSENRLEQCLQWLNSDEIGLPIGVSALYIKKYFNNETRREVKEIVHAIADELKNRLQNLKWVDEATRARARHKSEYMKRIVGHPDEMLNKKILDDYIKDLKVDPKDHFNNILNIRRFHFDNTLSLYNETGNYLWSVFSGVTETNALYYGTSNTFAILAGILRRPLFDPEWPSYAKYGSIGFIIGHEMMHAYDWDHIQFDETGSFRYWYSNKSAAEYRKRIDCFEKQYSNFTDDDFDISLDGKLTLDENIADNVGLKIAYDAFENHIKKSNGDLRLPGFKYTPEQLFWIYSVNFLCSRDSDMNRVQSMSRKHAPDDFRALGEMRNSKHFAETFNCPEGSPMNPIEKCKLV